MQEEKIKKCLKELIDTDVDIYNYVTPKGLRELRISIANYSHKKLNTKVDANEMIITSGSQQSIYLLARILLENNDTIISEEPTYFGAIKVFNELEINVLTVKISDKGIDLEELKEQLVLKPKFIYVVPTFHNPTGISWKNDNRKEFLKIVNEYGVTVIEDDPYSELNYTNTKFKSLYELNEGKNIIYLGTFSKTICPSLTVGYILAEPKMIERLYEYKYLNDLNTSIFIQKFIHLYLDKYNLDEDIKNKRKLLRKKFQDIKKQLSYEFPNMPFSSVQGGMFMALYFPNKKIDFSIYEPNYYKKDKQDIVRINIANTSADEVCRMIREINSC